MVPILISAAILIFSLMNFVPGDPALIALGENASYTEADVAAMQAHLGLDQPFIVRLASYLKGVFLHLDFGNSYTRGTSVRLELADRFPTTVFLACCCVLLILLVGIPVGVRAAVKANTFEDRLSMFLTLLGNCIPSFWLALMLTLLFSLTLGWLPSSGAKSLKYFILPAISGAAGGIAGIARQTRASMLEVIRSDFVTAARSKGLSERSVIYGHALSNALIPIITVSGQQLGRMMGGIAIIETIFSIPGLGSFLVSSIKLRDYPSVQGCVLYIAFTVSIIMLLTDLLYAFVDPRFKAQYVGTKKRGSTK